MGPREKTDTIMRKYMKDILCENDWEKRIIVFQQAVNETQSLCLDAEEERAGETPAQVLKIFNTQRHT